MASQTRKDRESNTPEPYSLTTASPSHYRQEPLAACGAADTANNKAMHSRNPITGIGLNGDGVGGLKPMKTKSRRGDEVNDFFLFCIKVEQNIKTA